MNILRYFGYIITPVDNLLKYCSKLILGIHQSPIGYNLLTRTQAIHINTAIEQSQIHISGRTKR